GNASGSGMFAFNRHLDEAHMMVVASELSSPFQSAHIHNGAIGVSGPVVLNITDKWSKNGSFFYLTTEFTKSLADLIQAKNAYVNVHTTTNPSGEIRGQITKTPDCPFQSAVIDLGSQSFELDVFPNPVSNMLKVRFDGDQKLFQNTTIQIRDLSGKLLFTQKTDETETTIDIGDFAPGIYLMNASSNTYSASIKVVKI
ncbi:MAG: CHRD domain-containing protein, partial [Saprospiraceae bacterium]